MLTRGGWGGLGLFKVGVTAFVCMAVFAAHRRNRPCAGLLLLSFSCAALAVAVTYSSHLATGPAAHPRAEIDANAAWAARLDAAFRADQESTQRCWSA